MNNLVAISKSKRAKIESWYQHLWKNENNFFESMQHTAHLNLGTPFPQLILSMVTLPAKCWLMANMFLSELLEIRFVKTSRPVFANPCQASSGSQHCLHEKIFHWAVAIMASRILEDDISNGTTFTAALASFLQNSTLVKRNDQVFRGQSASPGQIPQPTQKSVGEPD